MRSFYAFRSKTVEYIIILTSLIFKLFNEAGSNIQTGCTRSVWQTADNACWEGGLCGKRRSFSEVRHSSGEAEEDHKYLGYFLQEPQGDYKLTPCQTRPNFAATSNTSMPSKVLLFFMNGVEGKGDKPAKHDILLILKFPCVITMGLGPSTPMTNAPHRPLNNDCVLCLSVFASHTRLLSVSLLSRIH